MIVFQQTLQQHRKNKRHRISRLFRFSLPAAGLLQYIFTKIETILEKRTNEEETIRDNLCRNYSWIIGRHNERMSRVLRNKKWKSLTGRCAISIMES